MRVRSVGLLAGFSLLGLANVVNAADETTRVAAAQSATKSETTLEEILVTARRQTESAQDVPLVVQALTSDQLSKLNIRTFQEITTLVPGLTLSATGRSQDTTTSLRGIQFNVAASGFNGTIENYYNDAPTTGSFLYQAMFDVGQIEVLRGPQGTLRGRSVPSGSITVTPHRPDLNEFGGYVYATANDIGTTNVNGAVNFPIVDGKLAVRIAALSESGDNNRVTSINSPNIPPSNKTQAGRVSIRFEPIDTLSILLGFSRLNQRLYGYTQMESANIADPSQPASPVTIKAKDRLSPQIVPGTTLNTFDVYNVQADWTVLRHKISYVGSKTNYENVATGPDETTGFFAAYPSAVYNSGQYTFTHAYQETHELRIASAEPVFGHLDYVFGGFSNRGNPPTDLTSKTLIFLTPGAISPSTGFTIVNTPVLRRGTSKEDSVFANFTLRLLENNALELSLGGRRISYKATGHTIISGAEPPGSAQNDSFHHDIYNASAKYRINPNIMAYVSTGTSWRPGISVVGDFSVAQSSLERSFLVLPPETSRSYEAGVKTNWLDNRLMLNGTIYHQDFTNYPWRSPSGVFYVNYSAAAPTVPALASFNFVGAEPVKVDGLEVEAAYRAGQHFNVGGTASYAYGKIENGVVPCNDYAPRDGVPDSTGTVPTVATILATGQNLSGCAASYRAALAPLFSASVQSEYTRELKNGYGGFLRGLLSYYGDSQNDPTNALDDVKSYSLLNLYLGVRDPKGAWEVSLYGKNIANTVRVLSRGSTPITVNYRTLAGAQTITSTYRGVTTTAPREVGVNFNYAFGSK